MTPQNASCQETSDKLYNIFDSHAHYDDEQFENDRNQLLSSLPQKGVAAVMNAACDMESCKSSMALARRFPFVYCAVGVHPHSAAEAPKGYLQTLAGYVAAEPKVRAIGEIGLDYHYDFSPRETQRRVFEEQLRLADQLELPVIIHDREAHQDMLELLQKYRPKGVVHCYSGSAEMARELLKLGLFLGFTGAVTFKNARKALETLEIIPNDRFLIETDAPYMAPVPHRGKRNDSSLLPFVAETIAAVKGMTAQQVVDHANGNASRLFGIILG